MTFFSDEWAFIQVPLADPSTWLPPHNEHWSTLPIFAYRFLVDTVGLRTYVPYLAVVVALHGLVVVLVFVAIRRSSGPLAAVAVAVLLLLYGSGFENLYWGIQTGFVGATAAGVAALLALDRRDDRGRAGVAILLTIGLATAGIELAFCVAVGIEAILSRRLRTMFVPLAIPAAIYAAWFLAFGRFGVRTGTAARTPSSTSRTRSSPVSRTRPGRSPASGRRSGSCRSSALRCGRCGGSGGTADCRRGSSAAWRGSRPSTG